MKVSSAADEIAKLPIGNIFLLFLCGVLLHLCFLAFNIVLTTPLHLGTSTRSAATRHNFIASAEAASVCVRAAVAERKAVIILASQKTLPVAVTVISYLPDDTWQLGILVIPCTYRATSLCYHTNTMPPLPPTGIYLYD